MRELVGSQFPLDQASFLIDVSYQYVGNSLDSLGEVLSKIIV
jgi:hypothetical protein